MCGFVEEPGPVEAEEPKRLPGPRQIVLEDDGAGHWVVRLGDRSADDLGWDDALGLVVELMLRSGAPQRGHWLKTAEERAAEEERWRTKNQDGIRKADEWEARDNRTTEELLHAADAAGCVLTGVYGETLRRAVANFRAMHEGRDQTGF